MLDRNQFVLNVLELYDELDKTKQAVAAYQLHNDINASANQEQSPVYEMLVMIGLQKMSKDLIDDWHFESYAPKVTVQVGEDSSKILTYEEWHSLIKSSHFNSDSLIKYIGYSGTSFEDVMRLLDTDLRKFYAKKVRDAANENVRESN